MKSNILPAIALLAAVAALVLLPVSAVAASIAITVTGLLSVFVADYGRAVGPVRVQAPVVPFNSPGCPSVGMRTAA